MIFSHCRCLSLAKFIIHRLTLGFYIYGQLTPAYVFICQMLLIHFPGCKGQTSIDGLIIQCFLWSPLVRYKIIKSDSEYLVTMCVLHCIALPNLALWAHKIHIFPSFRILLFTFWRSIPASTSMSEYPSSDIKIGFEELCPVCGDKVSGYHYGLQTCESCKGRSLSSTLYQLHFIALPSYTQLIY